jgi:hypothetical protein
MKRLLLVFAVLGLFAAAISASTPASLSHKPHKVKRHKGVKHHA